LRFISVKLARKLVKWYLFSRRRGRVADILSVVNDTDRW
jgi:hypothetical protein